MELSVQVKDYLFAVGFGKAVDDKANDDKADDGKAAGKAANDLGGQEFGELITECVERVKALIRNVDEDLKDVLSSSQPDLPDLTCKQWLGRVEEKVTPNPHTPLLTLCQNLITVKHGVAKAAAMRISGDVDNSIMTLEEWVGLNDSNIIKFFDIPDKTYKAPYLSLDAKKIMRSLTYELRPLHKNGYIHGGLSMQSILIRKHDLGVGLISCSFQQGDPKVDHDALRGIMRSLIGNKLELSDYPGELNDFVHNEKRHLMYFHAAFMSPYDKISLIEQFVCAVDKYAVFRNWLEVAKFSKKEEKKKGKGSSRDTTLGNVFYTNLSTYKFLGDFHKRHETTYDEYHYTARPMVVMRDGFHHMDDFVSVATDSAELSILRNVTLSELACENYLSQVMEVIIDKLEDGSIGDCDLIKDAIYGHFNLTEGGAA